MPPPRSHFTFYLVQYERYTLKAPGRFYTTSFAHATAVVVLPHQLSLSTSSLTAIHCRGSPPNHSALRNIPFGQTPRPPLLYSFGGTFLIKKQCCRRRNSLSIEDFKTQSMRSKSTTIQRTTTTEEERKNPKPRFYLGVVGPAGAI